jgi:hypothetical protein
VGHPPPSNQGMDGPSDARAVGEPRSGAASAGAQGEPPGPPGPLLPCVATWPAALLPVHAADRPQPAGSGDDQLARTRSLLLH